MSGTTSFEPNNMRQEANRVERPRADEAAGGAPAGDSTGHGGCRSSFLEPPTRSSSRARDPTSKNRLWKLPEPWTHRTRPPLLGKPPRFPTATTSPYSFLR